MGCRGAFHVRITLHIPPGFLLILLFEERPNNQQVSESRVRVHALVEQVVHLDHIASSGDPFEKGSARPLDFGHWVAHKLEQLSDFRVGHGDAVAIGLAVDLLYSARIGLVKEATAYRAINLIERLGFSTYDAILHQVDKDDISVILKGLDEFREHLGGELTITLIQGIGEGVEVHAMDKMHIKSALDELRERHLAVTAK